MLDTVKRESIYQPLQPGLKFPEKPVFATHAEERRHRQQRDHERDLGGIDDPDRAFGRDPEILGDVGQRQVGHRFGMAFAVIHAEPTHVNRNVPTLRGEVRE